MKREKDDCPLELFDPKESERRLNEAMRRICHKPATMNMTTGQNLKEPFLLESELKQRGYPCECGFE